MLDNVAELVNDWILLCRHLIILKSAIEKDKEWVQALRFNQYWLRCLFHRFESGHDLALMVKREPKLVQATFIDNLTAPFSRIVL